MLGSYGLLSSGTGEGSVLAARAVHARVQQATEVERAGRGGGEISPGQPGHGRTYEGRPARQS